MRAICLWLAAAGFVASAVLHLLSFTPWAFLAGERIIWTLGVLCFALAAAMVARLRRTAALGRRWARVDELRPVPAARPAGGSPAGDHASHGLGPPHLLLPR